MMPPKGAVLGGGRRKKRDFFDGRVDDRRKRRRFFFSLLFVVLERIASVAIGLASVKHAPTAIDPSGNTVGMAMCMYLNSGSVVPNFASRVSDGSARPFTAQAYSILSFVGVNAYLCDDALNDDDER